MTRYRVRESSTTEWQYFNDVKSCYLFADYCGPGEYVIEVVDDVTECGYRRTFSHFNNSDAVRQVKEKTV